MGSGFWSDNSVYFMIGVTGSRLHFRNPEKFWRGKIYVFRPTCSSGFSRYGLMVKSTGFLLRRTRYLVPNARQMRLPIMLINWCPPCLSFARCLFYSYQSSLVIGILLCLVWIKECGFSTHSLGLGWPLYEVGIWVGSEVGLFHPLPPHK